MVEMLVRTDSRLSISCGTLCHDQDAPDFENIQPGRFPEIVHLRWLAVLNRQPTIGPNRCNTSRKVVRVHQ